jgi:nicotinamide-nucleotide amidase
VAESLLGDKLGPLDFGEGISLAYLPAAEGVDLRLTIAGVDAATADRRLEVAANTVRLVVGAPIYGEGATDLAAVVLEKSRAKRCTISVAESCTGGLLGGRLTAIAGASDVFMGGVIAYDNRIKAEMLGVADAQLREHGAVSEPVVRAMAAGVRDRFRTSIGMAITGIAGPGGGTAEKPVGTVWIAVDVDGAVVARRFNMIGDRDEIRRRSAQAALEMLRQAL